MKWEYLAEAPWRECVRCKRGFQPGDHLFLTCPACRLTSRRQANPARWLAQAIAQRGRRLLRMFRDDVSPGWEDTVRAYEECR